MPPTSMNRTLYEALWRAHDLLAIDDNTSVVFRIEHLAWLVYLRCLDQVTPLLRGPLAWDAWAGTDALAARSDDELVSIVQTQLAPGLAELRGTPLAATVAALFSNETSGGRRGTRPLAVCRSGANLRQVVAAVHTLDPTSAADRAAAVHFFEALLARSIAGSPILGEFYTPRPVVRLMVDLLDIQPHETVYDPAFGTAGLLAQAIDSGPLREVFGLEQKAFPALVGATLLALRGCVSSHVARANTLHMPLDRGRRADVILTNPYFADIGQEHAPQHFPVRTGSTDLLFVQHVMARLKRRAGARAAIVVPEGFLFRGEAHAAVKRTLLDQIHLAGIISLPVGTFAPFSDLKTAILVLERPNPSTAGVTWCYQLEPPEGQRFRKSYPVTDAHLGEARALWRTWLAEQRKPHLGAKPCTWPDASRSPNAWLEPVSTWHARSFDLRLRSPVAATPSRRESPQAILKRLRENNARRQELLQRLHARLRDAE